MITFLVWLLIGAAIIAAAAVVQWRHRGRARRVADAKPSPTTAAIAEMFKQRFTPERMAAMVDRPHPLLDGIRLDGRDVAYYYTRTVQWEEPDPARKPYSPIGDHDPGDEDPS